jgi:hypothetical protein
VLARVKGTLAALLLVFAGAAAAQEAELTLMGMRVGKDSLSDVLSRIGLAPLAPGKAEAPDELCYAAENPFESTWVVFGSGASGRWERLTYIRVLSVAPPGLSCRRTPLITASVAIDSGIRKGMLLEELRARFGPPSQADGELAVFAVGGRTLRTIAKNGKLTAFELLAD